MILDEKKMSEAEVSLRLALYLIKHRLVCSMVEVAIDGAQIQVSDDIFFPIKEFLSEQGCIKKDTDQSWRGLYTVGDSSLVIHSSPGKGDVTTQLISGKKLYVESKKGTLIKSKSSSEYPLLREAIGQLITNQNVEEDAILAVAVPFSQKFAELITKWRNSPLIKKIGLQFLMVHRNGNVDGLMS